MIPPSFRLRTLCATAVGLTVPMASFAQGFMDKVKMGAGDAAKRSGLDQTGSIQDIIGNVIYAVLSFSGILLLGFMLYAGFLWMTAGGNADQTKMARQYIQNAVIGLIIVVSSFAIVSFVLEQLSTTVSGSGGYSDVGDE
jgi:hypothetical protein